MEIEVDHISSVLEQAIIALKSNNSGKLKELSNQTLHCATCIQDAGSISIAVMNYALAKLIERDQHIRIKNWNLIVKKLTLYFQVAISELKKGNVPKYEKSLIDARKTLTGISDIKSAIKEVMSKSAINKASKLYEHGLSMGQTANLLGVTNWDISEYASQRANIPISSGRKLNVKSRAQMALQFFS